MIGKFKIKQINKRTGDSKVILEESNQIAQGMKHALVNILSGKGSRDIEDYQFKYFQLGTQNYNLSTFNISADVPASSLKSNMWTLKDPMSPSAYGTDSVVSVVKKDIYGLGSIVPPRKLFPPKKFFDNFVDPPDTTKLKLSYTNNFEVGPRKSDDPREKSITTWIPGCANTWENSAENYFYHPLELSADYTVSGPTFTSPTWSVIYNNNTSVAGITSCLRINTAYVYNDGSMPDPFSMGKTDQTFSTYYSTEYYASGIAASSSTPIGGAIQIFNRTGQVLTTQSRGGQNRVSFKYRYDLDYSSSDAGAAWYPPEILDGDTYSSYEKCSTNSTCLANWNATYGSGVTAGDVSGNIECVSGAMYTHTDALNGYATRSGPGSGCYDAPNSGFGPKGNFYRVSISWNNVPSRLLTIDTGVVSGLSIQAFHYPLLSSLSGISSGGDTSGHTDHNLTPREQAYIANAQFEFNPTATPYQYVHAEQSYYITSSQDFLVIPRGYVTSLNDNTANVRLLLDENLANNQTIKEVGLFLKNPEGNLGIDNPFLSAYKVINPPITKNNEFSYIIDWELSLVDSTPT
tara:strand:+ start:59 stop:1783 length:1725 start_codon:yes stop_codon:yes gene_type:complete